MECFEKNKTTGTDSSVLHFDKNYKNKLFEWKRNIRSWPSKQMSNSTIEIIEEGIKTPSKLK